MGRLRRGRVEDPVSVRRLHARRDSVAVPRADERHVAHAAAMAEPPVVVAPALTDQPLEPPVSEPGLIKD